MFLNCVILILILALSYIEVSYSQNTKTNACGTIYYEEPAIEGRNVTVIFNPTNTDSSNVIIWYKTLAGGWSQITENWKYTFSDNKLVIQTEKSESEVVVAVNYGQCNSDRIRIPLEELTGCGKFYQRTQNVRLGGVMELGYFPTQALIDNPALYVRTFRVVNGSCQGPYGCVVPISSNMYEVASLVNHEYVLRINQLIESVNGGYLLQCTTGRPQNVFTNSVQVRAPEKPSNPILVGTTYINDVYFIGKIGEPITIKCNITGGTSPLDVKLIVNGTERQVVPHGAIYQTTIPNVTPELHMAEVKCTVTNLALEVPLEAVSKIYVAVKPTVEVLVPNNMRIDDKTTFAYCSCKGERPAGRLTLAIYRTTNNILYNTSVVTDMSTDGTNLNLDTLSRNWNGNIMMCTFSQALVGFKVKITKRLLFNFPPKNITIESGQSFDEILPSYRYKLTCRVSEMYPACNISWSMYSRLTTTSATSGGYVLNTLSTSSMNVTKSDFGKIITCAASCAGFTSTTSSPHIIRIPYTPELSLNTTDTAINVTEGHSVVVKCSVSSYPSPDIQWIDFTDSVIQSSYTCGQTALCLPLYHVTENQTGVYRCRAKNELSNAIFKNITIRLQDHGDGNSDGQTSPDDTSTLMFVTAAISVAVLILVILIIVLIIRKRAKDKALTDDTQIVEERNNSEDRGVTEDSDVTYAVVSRPVIQTESTSQTAATCTNGSEKELIYADLDLPNPSERSRERPRIIGTSETEYVQIDFTKRAAPLPDSEPTEEAENIYMN